MGILKKHPTVCLNMIVKNESKVIIRCLSSLKHIIDHWVIVDTGSTDGTQEIIKDYMKDIPGELYESTWVDFAHNRSEALQYAKGKADYLFIIDADEILSLSNDFSWKDLYLDSYLVEFQDHGISYVRCQIVNNHLNWYYKGVLHEYIECKEAKNQGKYEGIKITRFLDGARSSDPHKFRKDALVLEKAILDEPLNDRYVFYLAQSYRDAGDIDQSIRYYKKRIEMKGWDQEVWYSMYQIAQLMEKRGDDWNQVLQAYLQAFQFRPNRVGPLFRILCYYMYNGKQYHIAHIFGKKAIALPIPNESLFIEKSLYDVFLPLEYAVCSFYVGNDEESIRYNNSILKRQDVSGEIFSRVLTNRKFSLDRIHPKKVEISEANHRIKVLIPFHNPGHFLDNCIERLLHQDYGSFEMIFIDNGSTDDSSERIPHDDNRIFKIRKEATIPEAECLYQALINYVDAEEICFILRGDDWLEDFQALSFINQYFQTYDCDFLYGQFRFSDGRHGLSMPLSCIDDMETEAILPVASAFRARAFYQLLQKNEQVEFLKSPQGKWLDGGQSQMALAHGLISELGFEKTHFTDQTLITYNMERLSDVVFPGLEKWVSKIKKHSQSASVIA